MKKFTKALALCLLIIVVGSMFASCGFIKTSISSKMFGGENYSIHEVAQTLENAGYSVRITENSDYDLLRADRFGGSYAHEEFEVLFFDNQLLAKVYFKGLTEDEWKYQVHSGDQSNLCCSQRGNIVYYGSNITAEILFGSN